MAVYKSKSIVVASGASGGMGSIKKRRKQYDRLDDLQRREMQRFAQSTRLRFLRCLLAKPALGFDPLQGTRT